MNYLATLRACLLLSVLVVGSLACPEEEQLETIGEPILVSPEECVLTCEGNIVRRGRCEYCLKVHPAWQGIRDMRMCPDWRERMREMYNAPFSDEGISFLEEN